MKLIHTADLHARGSSWKEFETSIEHIAMAAQKYKVQLIAIAGDVWDGPVQNSAGSYFPFFIDAIRSLANIAPVAMVYGTPSHDVEGSLAVFESMEATYSIKILQPGIAYSVRKGMIAELDSDNEAGAECILFGFPEPSYKWLLTKETREGGRSVELKAKEALSTLCMATGCMREKYPQIPCVVIAHGKIEGASMGKSLRIAPGQTLSFSKDNLKALMADYIAFGDIHEPQRIEGTRAWYAGSIYPLDFGEGHKAGCWAVTINSPGAPAIAERVAFPHPIKRHLISSGDCADEIPGMHGECVWYEIRCTREQASRLDPDIILSRLLGHGASKGSKVTLEIQPSENARSPEIKEAIGFEKKLEVWAEGAGEVLGEGIIEKARILAQETAKSNPIAGNARFIIEKLILRGAVGTWKKGRKDEIELKLSDKGTGVIAIAGRNGLGKTTLLENLHPWPRLLTRDGPLKNHFRLPDSFRDLIILDTQTDWRYRCLIRIRADIPSGSCEYWLFRDEGDGYAPLPGINGRLEPYEDWVERIFGKLEIFLRTAFIPQKPPRGIPDMAEATKGERKTLFGELAGIRWLEAYRLAAKGKAEVLSQEKTVAESKIGIYENTGEKEAETKKLITQIVNDMTALINRKDKLSGELAIAQACFESQQENRREKEKAIALREEASKAIGRAKSSERGLQEEIELYRISLRKKEDAEKTLEKSNVLDSKKKALEQIQSAIEAMNRKLSREYSEALSKYATLHEKRLKELDSARRNLSAQETTIAMIKERLKRPIDNICPTCGQVLPQNRLVQLKKDQENLKELLSKELTIMKEKKAQFENSSKNVEELNKPAPPKLIEFEEEDEIKTLNKELNGIDIRNIVETISRASIAGEKIADARKKIAALEKDISKSAVIEERCSRDIVKLEEKLKTYGKGDEVEDIKNSLTALSGEIIRMEERKAAAEKEVISLQADLEAKKKLVTRVKELAREVREWELLQKAAGPDGIQALELDALSPSISEIATRLLAASGNQGAVEIRTTRLGGKGSLQHQIEDFLIMYIDEEGNEQEISTLSGGESVWIRKAVYDAFEVIRARSTGLQFLTVVLDEADGALDTEARMRYLRMIEAAHSESGRFQTIIITHSLELQSMVDTCIAIESLGPSKNDDPAELRMPLAA